MKPSASLHVIGVTVLLWAFVIPTFASDLVIEEGPTRLRLDANSTSVAGTLRLINTSGNPLKLRIHAGAWTHTLLGKVTGSNLLFSQTADGKRVSELSPADLAKGAVLKVWFDASAINAPGVTEVELWNGLDKFGALQFERFDVPFGVKLDSSVGEILLAHGKKASFTLVNDDPYPYQLHWRLFLPGQADKQYEGTTTVDAKGSERVSFDVDTASPFRTWSWLTGILKDELQDGTLKLYFQPEQGVPPRHGVSAKTLPVKTRLRFYRTFGPIVNTGALILLLFTGAFFSVFLKLWLPNVRRKVALREKLDRLASLANDFSTGLGIRPIVHLYVQQTRLSEMLDAPRKIKLKWSPIRLKVVKRHSVRWTFSPDYEDILTECETGVDRVMKQVKLLSSLDRSAVRLANKASTDLPPSELKAVTEAIEPAVESAMAMEDDSDLQRVNAEVAQIAERINQLEQSATGFRPGLQARLTDVASFFGNVPPVLAPAVNRFLADLPGPFLVLTQFPKNEIPEGTSFNVLSDVDADVYKLTMIKDYVQLNPNLTIANPSSSTKEAIYPQLLRYLQLRSWGGVRTARDLLSQAEQGIYREDYEAALQTVSQGAYVWRDRVGISPNTSITLELRFHRKALNKAAARNEFQCVWSFQHPDGTEYPLPDPTWKMSRYFPVEGPYKIKIIFKDWNGRPVVDGQGNPMTVSDDVVVISPPRQRAGPRLRVELLLMILSQAPAVFALLTTAQQQVANVEWYSAVAGVLALGFGIDTLKNLITQKATK